MMPPLLVERFVSLGLYKGLIILSIISLTIILRTTRYNNLSKALNLYDQVKKCLE